MISGGLTSKEFNDLLDFLASSENKYVGVAYLPRNDIYKIRITRMYLFVYQLFNLLQVVLYESTYQIVILYTNGVVWFSLQPIIYVY